MAYICHKIVFYYSFASHQQQILLGFHSSSGLHCRRQGGRVVYCTVLRMNERWNLREQCENMRKNNNKNLLQKTAQCHHTAWHSPVAFDFSRIHRPHRKMSDRDILMKFSCHNVVSIICTYGKRACWIWICTNGAKRKKIWKALCNSSATRENSLC